MSTRQVAVVVSGFPRRSETFAINELLALEDRGMLAGIFATKPGDGGPHQPGIERLVPKLEILPDRSPREQGHYLAERLGRQRLSGIHAYFAHTPAEVAEYATRRLSLPFGFSVHARDARKVDPSTLGGRAGRAACVVACNPDVAGVLARAGARAHMVPHGVDLGRFAVTDEPSTPPIRLLAVGRLVEKKGFDVLIDALSHMDDAVTLRVVGDGPARADLVSRVAGLRLESRVTFAGVCTHAELPREYAMANVVVVPSVVDSTGDRDGLPNVLLEAMASGRAVVGTRVGAIAAAIEEGRNGLLVEPGSPAELARAISSLAVSKEWRASMGYRGRHVVEREYDLGDCTKCFADLLGGAYA